MRWVRRGALLAVVLLAGVWGYAWTARAPGEDLGAAFARLVGGMGGGGTGALGGAVVPRELALGGPFRLTDQDGRTVTEADLGPWSLVYFGYTYCPDICPTELGTVAAAIDALGDRGAAVTPVFITIDPERDTPQHLGDYVARFHPRMRALTGSPESIAAAARRFRVYYAKARRPENTDYLMDHSSFLYLVGSDGRVAALFRPESSPERIAAVIAERLGPAARS